MNKSILVVDDSANIRKIIRLTFEGIYNVFAVENGEKALELIKTTIPDLVLVDAIMPGISGYELCRTLKQDQRFQFIPIILMIGTFDTFDEEQGKTARYDLIISKPFESEFIIKTVTEEIDKSEQRIRLRSSDKEPDSVAEPEESDGPERQDEVEWDEIDKKDEEFFLEADSGEQLDETMMTSETDDLDQTFAPDEPASIDETEETPGHDSDMEQKAFLGPEISPASEVPEQAGELVTKPAATGPMPSPVLNKNEVDDFLSELKKEAATTSKKTVILKPRDFTHTQAKAHDDEEKWEEAEPTSSKTDEDWLESVPDKTEVKPDQIEEVHSEHDQPVTEVQDTQAEAEEIEYSESENVSGDSDQGPLSSDQDQLSTEADFAPTLPQGPETHPEEKEEIEALLEEPIETPDQVEISPERVDQTDDLGTSSSFEAEPAAEFDLPKDQEELVTPPPAQEAEDELFEPIADPTTMIGHTTPDSADDEIEPIMDGMDALDDEAELATTDSNESEPEPEIVHTPIYDFQKDLPIRDYATAQAQAESPDTATDDTVQEAEPPEPIDEQQEEIDQYSDKELPRSELPTTKLESDRERVRFDQEWPERSDLAEQAPAIEGSGPMTDEDLERLLALLIRKHGQEMSDHIADRLYSKVIRKFREFLDRELD
ncbi:response regulator [bacterium]|nr:response regulator [bacterium]